MKTIWSCAVSILLAIGSVSGHHSFAAEYDATRPMTLTGTVARIEWTSPHMHFYVDVKDDKGVVTQWKFEGYPPNMLVRQGWKRDTTMKPGNVITVFAWQARLDPRMAAAREVTFSDGRKLAVGPPAGTGGQ
jgi:hypothetical protein